MDLSMIIELISTMGFPIALVLVLGWFILKIYNDTTQNGKEREDKLYSEIEKNRLINEKAIETIQLYAERLTHIEDNVMEIRGDVMEIKQKL